MKGELQYFIKLFTRLKTFQTFRTVTRKFCKRLSFMSLDQSRGIEHQLKVLLDQSNKNWALIKRGRSSWSNSLITLIDWAKSQSIENSWIWHWKFQNLNFHYIIFINQYSPNLNIIITTYTCIHLYIQHDQPVRTLTSLSHT